VVRVVQNAAIMAKIQLQYETEPGELNFGHDILPYMGKIL